jgi:hypothetical protein
MDYLANCRQRAHTFYIELLRASISGLRDRLFELSEKAGNNADQRLYFETMRTIGERHPIVVATFEQHLQKIFIDFQKGIDKEVLTEIGSVDELTLVHRDKLEDDIAITVIVSKANAQYAEDLWKLNHRLAVLRGGRKVNDDSNPFGPEAVCTALQTGMHELDIDIKVRLFIYKYLGNLFIGAFAKILAQLNRQLIENGVLPHLKFVINKAPDEGLEDEEPVSEAGLTEQEDPQQIVAGNLHQKELYSNIRSWQNQQTGPRPATLGGVSYGTLPTDGTGGADTFKGNDYALVLTTIQQAPEISASPAALSQPLSPDVVEAQLVNRLNKQARAEGRHKVGRSEADIVDLVGMLFRYMLDDEQLVPAVKSLLSHLHTPYLKLALLDESMLDQPDHAARQLLNGLAEFGGRWVRDEKDRTVLPKLRQIVEFILKDFVDDTHLFVTLLDDFNLFREGVQKRAVMVEKRNRQMQAGLDRLQVSRQKAVREVAKRLSDYKIVRAIRRDLEKPWVDFLTFTLLRHDEESLSWRSALKVMDGAVWSVRPEAVQDQEEFAHLQIALQKQMREGLAAIGYDTMAAQLLVESLANAQQKAQQMYEQKVGDSEAASGKTENEDINQDNDQDDDDEYFEVSVESQLTPAEEVRMAELRTVKFGTWFEFDRPGMVPIQLKLSWYSGITEHYMFVNQAGVRQVVETLRSLASGLVEGRVRIVNLDKRTFMERALGSVFDRLRKIGSENN